jgi:hypothetical protein
MHTVYQFVAFLCFTLSMLLATAAASRSARAAGVVLEPPCAGGCATVGKWTCQNPGNPCGANNCRCNQWHVNGQNSGCDCGPPREFYMSGGSSASTSTAGMSTSSTSLTNH